LLSALDLTPGMTVADIGAGTGITPWRIAQRVGMGGTVYAVDIQPEMIRSSSNRCRGAPRQREGVLGHPNGSGCRLPVSTLR